MFKAFFRMFNRKSIPSSERYKSSITFLQESKGQVIPYPVRSEISLQDKATTTNMLSDLHEGSKDNNISIVANSNYFENTLTNKPSLLNHDFKQLIENSRHIGKKRAWDEQFKRNTLAMLKNYIEQIELYVKEGRDLSPIFKMLNLELEKTKISRSPFLKELTKSLANKNIPFTDQLKVGLQAASIVQTNNSQCFANKITHGRKYCLGSKKIR